MELLFWGLFVYAICGMLVVNLAEIDSKTWAEYGKQVMTWPTLGRK
jgi:hypothetical protein